MAHNVSEEGIHLDVYRDQEKVDTEHLTGPIPPAKAFSLAEAHLDEHAERYIERFEQWHTTQ